MLLRHLGEKAGVNLRVYVRMVTPMEERKILHNASNKYCLKRSSTQDMQQTVTAESDLQDVASLIASLHRSREPLLHCAVFLELSAPTMDDLKLLQSDVRIELLRSKLSVDRLFLHQQEGFLCVSPVGYNLLCTALGGCFVDIMKGDYRINVLEPKSWDSDADPQDLEAPMAFRQRTKLAQHISFLLDFFRCYKNFTDAHIDTIEIMVSKLYAK